MPPTADAADRRIGQLSAVRPSSGAPAREVRSAYAAAVAADQGVGAAKTGPASAAAANAGEANGDSAGMAGEGAATAMAGPTRTGRVQTGPGGASTATAGDSAPRLAEAGTADALARAVVEWFAHAARPLPWRAADVSPWAVLVSEFMLQQTQVSRVQPRWEEWMRRWPTPASLAAEPAAEAVRAWDRLGYPRRALWLHRAATEIVERHGGEVPRDLDALLALQGIGPYTAGAVAAFAFGDRHPVVDTNTRRGIARAVDGRAEPGPPAAGRDLAAMNALLPADREAAHRFNAGAMELGATVCTARAPRCDACPIADLCAWRAAGYPAYDGPRRARQARFEGSDRQARGIVMRELRAAHRPVPRAELERLFDDEARLTRAIDGLVADGLAVRTSDGYALPEA